ncbi:MAG TPA: hypothetical protein VIF14_10930 [Alphaproteobacteria bacterium]
MVAAPAVPAERVRASPLARAITVESVTGGEPTSPLWVSKVGNAEFDQALRRSLESAGLIAASPADAKYDLRANLVTLSQPMVGLDLTVKSSVKYTLVERATKRTVYDDFISVDHTATFGDHPFAYERLRLANEGSIRKNIETFIRDVVVRVQTPLPRRPARAAQRSGS